MKINQTIETMTLQQLQYAMMLHEQIRDVEKQLIRLNTPGRLTIKMVISLEEKLKMLKRKFALL